MVNIVFYLQENFVFHFLIRKDSRFLKFVSFVQEENLIFHFLISKDDILLKYISFVKVFLRSNENIPIV